MVGNVKIELLIVDREEAERLLRDAERFTHLLSFNGVSNNFPVEGYERVRNHHAAFFSDIEQPGHRGSPTIEHIRELVAFADKMKSYHDPICLLAHCTAGISRSTAGSFITLAHLYGPGEEARAMAEVMHVRGMADPNSLMVKLADDLLDRNGALTKQLDLARDLRARYLVGKSRD